MPARVEEMCGLVFVNLDPDATPLAELVGDLPQRLAPYRIETLEPFSPGTGTQPANWKAVADNYLEGYHIPIAHPGLMRLLDYKHYDVEVHDHYVWFDSPLRDKPSSNRLERAVRQARHADARARRAGPLHLALRLHLPQHDDRPLPGSGQHVADRSPTASTRTQRHVTRATGRPAPGPGRGSSSGPTTGSTRWSLDEDIDLVDNVQQGSRDPRLPLRSAVAPRARRGVVRRPDPGRHGTGARRRRDG